MTVRICQNMLICKLMCIVGEIYCVQMIPQKLGFNKLFLKLAIENVIDPVEESASWFELDKQHKASRVQDRSTRPKNGKSQGRSEGL